MNDLNRALGDIRSIRRQVAQSTEFRGYGPVTMAGTGVLAMLAAGTQAVWVSNAPDHITQYVGIWLVTALLSATFIAVQMVTRAQRMHSGMADEMIRMAVEQFLPAAGAGVLVTVALLTSVPAALWMLPGLWQIIFSLGVFSSCRFLPRPVIAAGVWYLLTGFACLTLGDGRALSPLSMGISYGAGQLLVAGILFFTAGESAYEIQE